MWGHSEREAIHKPERELSPEARPDDILLLDFGAYENIFLLSKLPGLWYFIITALADQYTNYSV